MLQSMVFLPPTTDFPPEPEPLDRELLNSTYRELRNCYASLMRSRAQHRRLANKAKEETALLRNRLTALASRDLPDRKEIYEILEIVTAIAGDIEDAGDDLVNGFSSYKKGRQSFQGGSSIGDLIRSVIHFINRWSRTKDRLGDLKQKQQELIDKSQELLPPLPPPSGNGHGPVAEPPTPLADLAQGSIATRTNGLQPQHPAEPQSPQPLPQPVEQAKGADDHG